MFRIETVTGRVDRPRRDLLRSRLRETNTDASPVLRALHGTAYEREVPLQIWAFAGAGAAAGSAGVPVAASSGPSASTAYAASAASSGDGEVPGAAGGVTGPGGGAGSGDADGELVAGLDAHTWGRWLHVNLLWVEARHRGSGLGSRLLAQAERMAREEHGCRNSRVWTWDFQAPDFYRKYGYEVVCEIPDYPPGITEYTLTKQLTETAGSHP